MDRAFTARPVIFGLLILAVSSASFAESGTPTAQRPTPRPGTPIVLASAIMDRQSESEDKKEAVDPNAPPKRKRTARVTTCRCGTQAGAADD